MVRFSALLALGLLCLASCAMAQTEGRSNILRDYVNYHDGFYAWNVSETVLRGSFAGKNYTAYNVYLTSQKWLTKNELYSTMSSNLWRHWAQVVVPDNLLPDADMAFLYIDGGSTKNFDQPPSSPIDLIVSVSVTSGTIGIDLSAVPNEPIYFAGDPENGRTEDAMIAYTWSHFINNTMEQDWLARMPMTKAAIKCMDAVQEFVSTLQGVSPIQRFAVAGASKRGWTTWMVGAVEDPRVVGIAPIVAPIANIVPQMNEMWQSYGNWSFALQDYVDMDLMGWLNLPRFKQLLNIIDPLAYPEAMEKIPKMVVVAALDEFFMPDAAKWYWNELKGFKMLEIVPNADHSLAGHAASVLTSVEQFYMTVYYNQTDLLPSYEWEISEDGGTITLTTQQTDYISQARVLISYNNTNRDWRLLTCSDAIKCINLRLFQEIILEPISPGVYQYIAPFPPEGQYTAFYIEVDYLFSLNPVGEDKPLRITSNMSIIPTTMPYPPCAQDICACGYDCATNYYTPDDG